jgi:hypothetical protein
VNDNQFNMSENFVFFVALTWLSDVMIKDKKRDILNDKQSTAFYTFATGIL